MEIRQWMLTHNQMMLMSHPYINSLFSDAHKTGYV
jgi:hypothetical protein